MANELCKRLGLTPTEWEILEHRLAADDAIVDVFGSTEDLEKWHSDDVQEVCQCLWHGDLSEAEGISPDIAREVLADAVEGSTYLANADEYESPQKCAALRRAYSRLAEKIGKYVGREIEERDF